MASEQDHYAVLRVHPEAEPEVIAAAYRSLAQLYHPDRNPSPESNRLMVQINLAYEVLRDPERRAAYDQSRRFLEHGARDDAGQRAAYQSSRSPYAYDEQDDEPQEWEREPRPVGVRVVTAGGGWSGCCGCIVLIVLVVILVSMCGTAIGLS